MCISSILRHPKNRDSFQKLVRKVTPKERKPFERQVGSPKLQVRASCVGYVSAGLGKC